MKFQFFILVIMLAFIYESYSQTDTVFIHLKSGNLEKIAVSQIQKITFENLPSSVAQSKGASSLVTKGNYPNPFSEQTNIEFEIALPGNVSVLIYDNSGNEIQKLECSNCQAGKNTFQWNCIDKNNNRVSSGVYFYEVRFGKVVQSKKMLVVR